MAGDLATRPHALPMCCHVVAVAKRETRTSGHIGYLIPEIFPSMGRLDRGHSEDRDR